MATNQQKKIKKWELEGEQMPNNGMLPTAPKY